MIQPDLVCGSKHREPSPVWLAERRPIWRRMPVERSGTAGAQRRHRCFVRRFPVRDGWNGEQVLVATRFRRGPPVTGREAQFERSGTGAPEHKGRRQVWNAERLAGARSQIARPRKRNTRPRCVGGLPGDGRRKGGRGRETSDSQRSSADAPLNKGTRRKAQTRGREKGTDC